jgi:hypothetical protein
MIFKFIDKYCILSLSYGLTRGFIYNYKRDDICNNDKIATIIATSLITPFYILVSLEHDKKNLELLLNNKETIKNDWLGFRF